MVEIPMKHDNSQPVAGTGHLDVDRYDLDAVRVFGCRVLESEEVPSGHAREVVACLLSADLRGVDSHGLVRLPVYLRRLRANVVKAHPSIRVELGDGPVGLVDGDNGLGPVVGSRAMQEAIGVAERLSVGVIGVRGSNHFGAAAFYVQKAVAQEMIGIVASNAPPNMAPHGGRERFLGTNPFAIGVPAGEEPPLIFDASSSVVARGKIIVRAKQGLPIPEGWAIDPQGLPTTNAQAALEGAVLPFGGAKGSGISLIIDILCGVLTGAAFAARLRTLEDLNSEQNLGHLFIAMRTDAFVPAKDFSARMDEILRLLKSSAPAPGVVRVQAPGEPEAEKECHNRQLGVPLGQEVVQELILIGKECGVAFPSTPVRSDTLERGEL
jgi:LDH2 family malate/lactate/ureidoglycolate dehydrogenase